MNFQILIDHFPLILEGLWTTVWMVSISLAVGFVFSVPLAYVRHAKTPVLGSAVASFTFFFRGTPLLLQIYLIYYGSGQFEFVRESFFWLFLKEAHFCGLLAFTLNTTAYTCEIIRGALDNTPGSEIEAAESFGMSRFQTYAHIIFPSSLRRALPAYGNEAIFMFQGSAIVSVITIMDLTGAARYLYSKYYDPFTPFVGAGAIYLALIFLIVLCFGLAEKKFLAHLGVKRDAAPKLFS